MKQIIERYPASFGAMIVAAIGLIFYIVFLGVGEVGFRVIQIFMDCPVRPIETPIRNLYVASPIFGFSIIVLVLFYGAIAVRFWRVSSEAFAIAAAYLIARCRSVGLWLANRCDDLADDVCHH